MSEITTRPVIIQPSYKVQVVYRDDRPIGLVSKRRNTRTERHPWVAYRGIAENADVVGFYNDKAEAVAKVASY